MQDIQNLLEKDDECVFSAKLTEFVREYQLLKTGFDLNAIPFKGDFEKMISFDLASRSLDLEKQWDKYQLAKEEKEMFPDNRHKKMAFTKTKKTFFKMLEKMGFPNNEEDGMGGVEAQWVWLWYENNKPMDETIFPEDIQKSREDWRVKQKEDLLRKQGKIV